MEGIITPILQMGNEGKAQREAPGRTWLPQKEVVELPCRDTATLCTAAAGDFVQGHTGNQYHIPSKFKFVVCQTKCIHYRTLLLLRNHEMSQSLREGNKLRKPQWLLLITERCTSWHLNMRFPLNFTFYD